MTTADSLSVRAIGLGAPRRAVRAVGRYALRLAMWLAVAAVILVIVYPLVWMVLNSFKAQNEFVSDPVWSLPSHLEWRNYVDALGEGNVARYMLNSVIVTAPALAMILLLGVSAGFALEVLVFKGRAAIMLTFLAGIMIPGQMLLLPLFNAYFTLGLTGTYVPMILTYTATGLPLTVFMAATYFHSIPREVFEAAAMDGANMLRSYWSIGLPMVRNAVFTIAVVQFFFIWNDLLIAITFGNSTKLSTIQVGLLNFSGEFGAVKYGPLFAANCINLLAVMVLYAVLNKRIMKGLTDGAVKG